MTLSTTQSTILRNAAHHPEGQVVSPVHLPPGPRASIARALLTAGFVARTESSDGGASWKLDGEIMWLAITDEGRRAVADVNADIAPDPEPVSPSANTPATPIEETACGREALKTSPSSEPRPKLRETATTLLARWDATTERAELADAVAALRASLGSTARQTSSVRARQGTKQEAVLTLLRRPEGSYHCKRNGDDRLGPAHGPRLFRRPEEEGAHRRSSGPRPPGRTGQRRR